MSTSKDRNGSTVAVGSRVRIVELPQGLLESLPEDEQEELRSMLGETFKVLEITKNGYAAVEKEWHYPEEGHYMSHSLTLTDKEMELVDDN